MSSSASDMTGPGDGEATPARLRNRPTRLLALVALHSDRLVTEGLAGLEARRWHYAALASLQEFGPASQTELSRRTRIHRSDLVAVINELAERGFVERAPDPADRRRNVITMTPQGRGHLHRLDDLLATIEDDVLAPLAPAERLQFTELLTRLLDHHGRSCFRDA
ncbi:MarR family winged helix-turn-helix transcriptional regulator [Planobispora longispora]|uniref:HTH marR-type domain-containing protein n=1 Tax=Planobispora longispora TaxID=28887 RepID=A0A8J3RNB2_9ACTN|nr:MarR family transcriptional regulator [Planobispora longispora]GIH78150.1 hypothetical protein Plo01_45790 [Planobispora longispora]